MTNEIKLEGGNLSEVFKVGDTVRRPIKPWSTAVQKLLRHLEKKQINGCPRFLGIDEKGREILTYLEGETGEGGDIWSEETLTAVAQFLRRYHDATVDFLPAPDNSWQYIYPDVRQHEVICHNDFAPYNMIFNGRQLVGLIDFDVAGPGPRLRDVATAVYWFAPLSFSSELTPRSQAEIENGGQRTRLFCQSYGLDLTTDLLDMIAEWLKMMFTFPAEQVQAGRLEYQRLIDEGHVDHWHREYQAYCAIQPQLNALLI